VVTDLKHLLSLNPLLPAYVTEGWQGGAQAVAQKWVEFDAGVVSIGHAGEGFAFDNELPRHRQFVEPYALTHRLVTNGEYLAFIEDGGYTQAACWLAEAWDWLQAGAIRHPLYWRQAGDAWSEFTLYGMQSLDLQRPATHLSLYEADAYARWAGARLPSEAEWEHAAGGVSDFGRHQLHPAVATGSESRLVQLYGTCWQWTLSSYAPYPGYRAAPGAVGEYNGKFMCNQYVLRGSSCATPEAHTRRTYRNFFPAYARWQFSGIRLARSA
jgi:ergothioneine biosynthesis protein EgtB